ncbi:primosomal protein N', partial [Candidatus Auribacterota bacterium]
MKSKAYAKIVVELPLSHAFDYSVPPSLRDTVSIGSRVWIPFGRKEVTGYIVDFCEIPDFEKTKEVIGLVEKTPLLDQKIIKLAYFISDYYCCPIGLVFKCMLPKAVRKLKRREKYFYYVENLFSKQQLKNFIALLSKNSFKQKEVLERLFLYKRHVSIPAKDLFEEEINLSLLKSLEKRGVLKIHKTQENFEEDDIYIKTKPLTLTLEQNQAMTILNKELDKEQFSPVLLHGVTGSGKTEIYLQIIERCLKQGKQAIVIVPEISLTPQTIERFQSRFSGEVAVLHSRLSDGERYYNWKKIKEGRASIAIGPRSAIFSPFENLGVVVVDEEHERSYKQEESPKYNARDIAVVRAKYEKALIILGSATPCLESYHNALQNKYKLIELTKRIDNCLLPTITIVDMKREIKENPKTGLFSQILLANIDKRIKKGEQVILFLNKRGYSRFLLCLDCGEVLKCKYCSLSLTYHKPEHRLRCHTCGFSQRIPLFCPTCKGRNIKFSGYGTQKIELQLSKIFPDARVGRMDADTTSAKGSHQRILDTFKTGKIDILIGTQMIAKGLDFPNVTLVGVISADSTLHIPDFRAGENTFQLLTQVSGRAGRGDLHGEVLIQTFTPDHLAIKAALKSDYKAFFLKELKDRKELRYPPLSRCINITIIGTQDEEVKNLALKFNQMLKNSSFPLIKLGPVPAPIHKVKNKFRWQILLKSGRRSPIESMVKEAVSKLKNKEKSSIIIDVD